MKNKRNKPIYYATYNRYTDEVNNISIGNLECYKYSAIPYKDRKIPYIISIDRPADINDFICAYDRSKLGIEE